MAMRGTLSPRQRHTTRRLLLVADHPLVRQGLIALIETAPDLAVCPAAATPWEGLEAIASTSPDLVIVDLAHQDGEGLALVQAIRVRHPRLPVLVLSMHDAPLFADRAFRAGADGYVTKPEMSATVLRVIRGVLNGQQYASPTLRAWRDRREPPGYPAPVASPPASVPASPGCHPSKHRGV